MSLQLRLRRRGYDLPTAFRALRAVVQNPDDLPQVFVIIDALSGRTLAKVAARVRRTPGGPDVMVDGRRIAALLRDRDALRSLPDGSLGRAYLDFVESEGISVEGIEDASARGRLGVERTADEEFAYARLRDTHDLWHALTGYRGDVVGELALLAFSVAQTRNTAILAILLVAIAKGFARGNLGLLLDGFRRGSAATWLPAIAWEELLARPVDELRRELGVGEPRTYTAVRTNELRDAGVLANAA